MYFDVQIKRNEKIKWLIRIRILIVFTLWATPVQAAAAPTVTAAPAATDQSAAWSWTGVSGLYRYSLDTETAWVETTDTGYTPTASLSEGNHTLYVQESDGAGGWSESGSATLYCLLTDSDGSVLISDAPDLTTFSDFVNANSANGLINAKLTSDITLSGNAANQWQPIGKSGEFRYRGVFDGQNHSISGIYINSTNLFIGFFGVSCGTIQNLTIKDSFIYGNNEVGGICGFANNSNLINCHNYASVSGDCYVGGITGQLLGTITNCSNAGAVIGNSGYIGGITGFQQGSVENCSNLAPVTSKTTTKNVSIGGISGILFSGSTKNCYNTGQITTEYSMGQINQGSIIGESSSSSSISIANCYYQSGTAPQGIGCFNFTRNPADIPSQTAAKGGTSFSGGEIAWLLQGNQSDMVWGQTLTVDPLPQLTNQMTKKVCRVSFDYDDSDTSDATTYQNPGAVLNILQTADYATTLNDAPYTETTYTVGNTDLNFVFKKRQAMTGISITPFSGTFDGLEHPAVTVSGQLSTASVTYSATGDAGSFSSSVPMVKDAGDQTVYVKITDYYYTDYLSGQLTATVSPASALTISPVQKNYTYSKNYPSESVDLAVLLPSDLGTTTYSLIPPAVTMMFDYIAINNGKLTYGIRSGSAVGLINTIAVTVDSQNYDNFTIAVELAFTDKEILSIGGMSCSDKTYNGAPATPEGTLSITDAGNTTVDPGTLLYHYTSTDSGTYDSSDAPTAAGSYQLVISIPADNSDYSGSSAPIPFRIKPKEIVIKAVDQTITLGMDRPTDVLDPVDLIAGESISGVTFSCNYIKGDSIFGITGTYPITASGGTISSSNENYDIHYAAATLTVNPATPGGGGGGGVSTEMSGIVVTPQALTYDAEGSLTMAISGLPSGAVVFYSLDGSTFSTDPPLIQHAGEQTLFLKITCPGYTDYQTQVTFTVAKEAAPEIPAVTYYINDGAGTDSSATNGSIDLAALLPEDSGNRNFSVSSISDPVGLLNGNPTVSSEGILSLSGASVREILSVNAKASDQPTTINVLASMENYQDATITVLVMENTDLIGVRYCTHIQDYGWENDWLSDGALSGTVGQSKRLEALKVELTGDFPEDASIETSVHVQNYGNLGPFAMGTEAGTSGLGLRMEEITLNLVNLPGYTLYYNVQVQNKGWLREEDDVSDWFVSGQTAGTTGQSLRLESIRIKLVKNQ